MSTYGQSGNLLETEEYEYYEFGELHRVKNSLHGTTTYVRDSDTMLLTDVIPSDVGKGATHFLYYPGTARVKKVIKSDGSFMNYDYFSNGLLQREYDGGTHDVRYAYDEQGQKTSMTTVHNGRFVVTQWDYDGHTGLLARKRINGVVVENYDYRADNQVASVTDAEGVKATCNYSPLTGDLEGITVSDEAGGSTTSAFDRMGRMTNTTVVGGIGEIYSYALDGRILTDTILGNGIIANATLNRAYDANHGGVVAMGYHVDPSVNVGMTVGYNDAVKVSTITSTNLQVQYGYSNNAFVSSVSISCGGSSVMTKNVGWDLANQRITNIAYQANGNTLAGFAYTYPTNSDRIAGVVEQDGTRWDYQYDSKGQLLAARKRNADLSDVPGMWFGYEYDEIGNTIKAGVIGEDGQPLYRFEADDFNFHTNRLWGSSIPVRGNASAEIRVTVNGIPAAQAGGRFSVLVPVDNGTGSLQTNVTVWVVKTSATPEVLMPATGTVFVAKSVEPVKWTSTGVLLSDSRFTYQWNSLGRLLSAVSTNASPNIKVMFDYYADGRRARKMVYKAVDETWTLVRRHEYFYDDWNLTCETISLASGSSTTNTYVWGLDLEGQRSGKLGQDSGPALNRAEGSGAGGIGGLLAITQTSNGVVKTYLPICDHNGNIRSLLDSSTRQLVAAYEYSPYGQLVGESGPAKDVCPFRFSSKYYDRETELYYYGYRYYDPAFDQVAEQGPEGRGGGIQPDSGVRERPGEQVGCAGVGCIRRLLA